MTLALVIAGILVGAYSDGPAGALMGGGIGYAIGALYAMGHRLDALEREMFRLKLTASEREPIRERLPAEDDFRSAVPASKGAGEPPPVEEETFAFQETAAEMPGEEIPLEQAPEPPRTSFPPQSTTPPADLLNRFLTGGSLLVKAGIVILFIGVSFLVKYAAEHDFFPIQVRLAAAAGAGVALLVIGWRLRKTRDVYAQALQGGGIGILYLTTFAALRLYSLIPPAVAFPILVAVAILAGTLAVAQNACSLAFIGISGGFLAPILASTGGGSHVVLFSYYALLNCGIVGIARFRSWRALNLLGFVFTFFIGSLWGYRYYQPAFFSTTEPFLVLFFLIYTAVAVLFAVRQEPDLKGYVDGTLVFGTPVVAFALQTTLVSGHQFGLAWSALTLGLFYLALVAVLNLTGTGYMRSLREAFSAFGIVFLTLAVPLAFDNSWTSAAWALEGAGILWAGLRQQKPLARLFGIILLFGAGIAFLIDADLLRQWIPVLNGWFLGCMLLSASGLYSAYNLYRGRFAISSGEVAAGLALFVWGLLWWFGGGFGEIGTHVATGFRQGSLLLFLAASCTVCDWLSRRLSWPWLSWPALLLLPALSMISLTYLEGRIHPFSQWGFLGWPIAIAAFYRILLHQKEIPGNVLRFFHAGTLWLITFLAACEMGHQLHRISGGGLWPQLSWGIATSMALVAVARFFGKLPLQGENHLKTYLTLGCTPIAIGSGLWIIWMNFTSPGDSALFPYLPLLNPLDLTVCALFFALWIWIATLRSSFPQTLSSTDWKWVNGIYGALVFIWTNGVLVRTIHHWGGVQFSPGPLFDSVLLQSAFSIWWSLLALCTMVVATRRKLRIPWLAGAGLLAAVVVKLFLVDLSGTGTVERIVSFVGVGILLLIIGYASPVPPRELNSRSDSAGNDE